MLWSLIEGKIVVEKKTALLQTNDAFFENKNQKLIEISLGMMKLRIKMIIPPGFELSRIFRGRGWSDGSLSKPLVL